MHNTTVKSTTVHSTTVHSTTIHSTTVHSTTVHSTTIHSTTVHSTTVHSATVHTTTVHCTSYTSLPAVDPIIGVTHSYSVLLNQFQARKISNEYRTVVVNADYCLLLNNKSQSFLQSYILYSQCEKWCYVYYKASS